MFIPKYFQVKTMDEVIGFIEENSFATVVTTKKGEADCDSSPITASKSGGGINISLLGMLHMGILNGEHLKRVKVFLLFIKDHMRIFPLHGMGMKMYQHGISSYIKLTRMYSSCLSVAR